jgi:hypothetical protein
MATTKKEREAFYARNAAQGRTVRFSMKLDALNITDEQRTATGLSRIETTIERGTLTPEAAKRILDALFDALAPAKPPSSEALASASPSPLTPNAEDQVRSAIFGFLNRTPPPVYAEIGPNGGFAKRQEFAAALYAEVVRALTSAPPSPLAPDVDTSRILSAYGFAEQEAMRRDESDKCAADAFREVCDWLWPVLSDADRTALGQRNEIKAAPSVVGEIVAYLLERAPEIRKQTPGSAVPLIAHDFAAAVVQDAAAAIEQRWRRR